MIIQMNRGTGESVVASWVALLRHRARGGALVARPCEPFQALTINRASRRLPRYRRSPEGCLGSGLPLPDGRGAPPGRDAVACELRRNRVPWSRCTLFPLDVMTEPVVASAAPPERVKPWRPKTPLLPAVSIPAAAKPPLPPRPPPRAPLAAPPSHPTPPGAPSPHPTRPPPTPA